MATQSLTKGGYIATPTASTTPAQYQAAQAAGWVPTTATGSGATFAGGSVLPVQGSSAYTAAQNQTGNASYNPTTGALSINGQNVPLPPVNNVLNADRLGSATAASLPSPAPLTSGTSFVTGVTSALPPASATTSTTTSEPQKANTGSSIRDWLINTLQSNYNKLGDQSATEQNLRNQYQVDQNMQRLSELQGTIAQRTAGYLSQFQAAEGKAIPTPFIAGEQTQIQRTQAIEIGVLNAQAQALQGNIQAANDIIDRTMKYKFEPIQQQNQLLVSMYNIAQNDMSESEKLAAQLKISEKQKSDDRLQAAITAGLKAAAKPDSGATQQDILNISNAQSEAEAYILARPYFDSTTDRKSTRLNSSHVSESRMPSSA